MGWGQGWGEATERLLKYCVLGVSLPTLVLALDRGVWLQSLTICPWDRAVTSLRQPLHPRAGCHPSNGGPSGRAVCPPCLRSPHRAVAGCRPTPHPQAMEACSQGRQRGCPRLRREGKRPPHLSEDRLFQQDKAGRARQEERGLEGPHGRGMDAGGLQGQVGQVGPCRAMAGASGGPRSLLTHHALPHGQGRSWAPLGSTPSHLWAGEEALR